MSTPENFRNLMESDGRTVARFGRNAGAWCLSYPQIGYIMGGVNQRIKEVKCRTYLDADASRSARVPATGRPDYDKAKVF